MTYYTKLHDNEYVDLYENEKLVKDAKELDATIHSAFLYQQKAEYILRNHSTDKPLFLYYSMQLLHNSEEVPRKYMDRCVSSASHTDFEHKHCAMNLMIDEALLNITCVLENLPSSNNTVLVVSGATTGPAEVSGSNYPFRGHQGDYHRGGTSNTAIVHTQLLPDQARGTTFDKQVMITGSSLTSTFTIS